MARIPRAPHVYLAFWRVIRLWKCATGANVALDLSWVAVGTVPAPSRREDHERFTPSPPDGPTPTKHSQQTPFRLLLPTRGFTLLELTVVIVIIGILAAIAIPTFLNNRDKAHDAVAISALRNVASEGCSEAATAAVKPELVFPSPASGVPTNCLWLSEVLAKVELVLNSSLIPALPHAARKRSAKAPVSGFTRNAREPRPASYTSQSQATPTRASQALASRMSRALLARNLPAQV